MLKGGNEYKGQSKGGRDLAIDISVPNVPG